MTTRHVIDYYMDGFTMIAFCKVCSAEGDALFEECKGLIETPDSIERYKMARHLNLGPDQADWPMDILDRLIYIEKREGTNRLQEEIRKLTKYP